MSAAARRYAQALLEVSSEANRDRLLDQLKQLGVLLQDRAIRQFLVHPRLSFDQRIAVLTELDLAEGMKTYLRFLSSRNRLALLPDIAREYERLLYIRRGQHLITVTTATALEAEQLAELRSRLQQQLKADFLLQTQVRPAIGGGLIIDIDGKVINKSLAYKLERLRKQLAGD